MKRKQNAAEVYLQQWAPETDTYKTFYGALSRIARILDGKNLETFDWGLLRYSDVRGIGAKLVIESGKRAGEPCAPKTKNKMLSALRGVLESAWRDGQIPDEEYRRIKIEHEPGGRTEPSGEYLDDAKIAIVFAALDKMPPRDAALIAIMCACGLRRIEVVRLKKESYISEEIAAYGKGNKHRTVPVTARWQPFIERWVKTLESGAPMFADEFGKPITRAALSYAVNQFFESVNLRRSKGELFSPHDFRRSFITRVSSKSDISIAQKLCGHVSIASTVLYDKRGKDAMKKAVEDL